ncbi:MAG TPA: P1 family peptidase [Pedococcus sp.]
MATRPGPTNSLTDVRGLRVGHATRTEPGWLTGTTVVLAPGEGVVGGVDVRGGAPGTRETDLLAPHNLVDRVNAVVLTGGSAFGLAAASGVAEHLYAAGLGWPVGEPGEVVPIVPAAVLFDLGRGGVFAHHPGPEEGRAACAAAHDGPVEQGCVGAGTGARAGGLKGGVGSASAVLDDGTTVAALVAVNTHGAPWDPDTGELLAVRHGLAGEFDGVGVPSPAEVAEARERAAALAADEPLRPGMATVIGAVATDATLDKTGCRRMAGQGHDGLARAVRPVHTLLDGDTLFALATAGRPAPELPVLLELLAAAGDCVTRAVGHALLAATSVTTPAGELRSWRDAFPSAVTPPS